MFPRSLRLELAIALRSTGLALPIGLVVWQLCCWLQEPTFFRQMGLAIQWRGSSTAALLVSIIYFTVGRIWIAGRAASWAAAVGANVVLSAATHLGSLLAIVTLDSIRGVAGAVEPSLLLADSWLRCLPAAALAPGLCSRGWPTLATLGAVVASSILLLGLATIPGAHESPSLARVVAVTIATTGSLMITRFLASRQP